MKKLLPVVLAATLLAGCGAAPGLVSPTAKSGAAQALSKAGVQKGVRGMFRHFFEQADADKSGFLSVEEMPVAMPVQAPGEPPVDPIFAKRALFEKLDLNKNGRVTFNEFATKEQVQQVTVMFRREVAKLFVNLDQDGNRYLVAEEMAEAPLTLEEADINQNGKVTLSELEDAMAGVLALGGGFGKPVGPVAPEPEDPIPAPPADEPTTAWL